MRIVALAVLLSIASLLTAQTKPVVHKVATSPALTVCQAERAQLNEDLNSTVMEEVKLETANKELEARNAELTKKYDELRLAAKGVLDYTQTLDGQYRNMLADFKFLSEAYDREVAQRNRAEMAVSSQQQANMAHQQRVANALALYQMMPKVTFTPLPPPLVFAPASNNNIHCSSYSSGGSTQTDCR